MITKADISAYIPLAANLDSTRIELYAKEQERLRLTKILGSKFYEDIKDNESDYTEIITQIKPMLVYWTYVKYIRTGSTFNTAGGAVVKRTDYSIPLSDKELEELINSNVEVARSYESALISYLEENKDDYPLYDSGESKHTGRFSLKISST